MAMMIYLIGGFGIFLQSAALSNSAALYEAGSDAKIGHVLKSNPFMVLVGRYRDPETGFLKNYYTDSVQRTWAEGRSYCHNLTMEPVSPNSNDEVLFITGQTSTSPCEYYWTSGRKQSSWVWETLLQPAFPIYDSPIWGENEVEPECIVLHKTEALHAMTCTVPECTLCELRMK